MIVLELLLLIDVANLLASSPPLDGVLAVDGAHVSGERPPVGVAVAADVARHPDLEVDDPVVAGELRVELEGLAALLALHRPLPHVGDCGFEGEQHEFGILLIFAFLSACRV